MRKHLALFTLVLLMSGCATYRTKYAGDEGKSDVKTTKDISHTFYLIGDAGLSPMQEMNPVLKALRERLVQADTNSTAIFLGDNIYPSGLPDPTDSTQAFIEARSHLDAQLNALDGFRGRPLFIPGNHDWYTQGIQGLARQEKYVGDYLDNKDAFLPQDGCPLRSVDINEDIALILIDTEWYLTHWDRHPNMNDKCEIKTREKFLEELEGLIRDNMEKTTLIAMHHPIFSDGIHGGQYTFAQQFYPSSIPVPVPLLGSLINVFRWASGASIEDISNKRYNELRQRIVTLAQYSENVILASGHEHTLQYIVKDNTPQIVSGSGAKKGASRLLFGNEFSTGARGYATLEVYTDGSSRVRYYGLNESYEEEFLFTAEVLPPEVTPLTTIYPEVHATQVSASVYEPENVKKGALHRKIWGERYREYYGTEVLVPSVNLDTLYGGLEPIRKGGGHQSKSLRLRHKSGKEYVMRALKKSAELYLQAMAFKNQFIVGDFHNTFTEDVLLDFYTGSFPYAPLAVGALSDAAGLYHTNPMLYYVPKQPALKQFNEEMGDELYLIEEHAGDGHGDLSSFGFSDDLKSTDTMLEDLRDDEKYEVDARLYIRARLFDMVIGDWDRHVDQWRWAQFKDEESGKIIYRPVPRDRDMAFSDFGDGWLMDIATRIIPGLRILEGFEEEIRSVRGFNSGPKTYVLDLALLTETTLQDWLEEAEYLQEQLLPEVIDSALMRFPEEVQDETLDDIKRILLARAERIPSTAQQYYGILNRYAIITGTDKDDWFEVNCLSPQEIEVKAYRIIDGEKERLFFHKVFGRDITREIWIYGLDDDDRFEVKGEFPAASKVRLIGGQNNDIYDVQDRNRHVYIYDYESRKNTYKNVKRAHVRKLDDYEVNTYRPLDIRSSTTQYLPTVGFNPDDGIKIGINATHTYNSFRQNPFTQRHRMSASYYFATSGYELGYTGEFANITENLNLELEGWFTSPNFSINFFGFGNDSSNPDDELDLDYNRVRLETFRFSPSLIWRGDLGARIRAGVSYEKIEVESTTDRFINEFYQENGEETGNSFFGADAAYSYENYDNPAFPTFGMAASLKLGYKNNINEAGGDFGYVIPELALDYNLLSSGRLVFATKWKGYFNIGNGYEFYQAASIGGNDGLRSFRFQRFAGKTAYYQQSDIRLNLNRFKTGLLPLTIGLYGGFDYGRVWYPNDPSNIWHTSVGGGFFLNGAGILTTTAALFTGEDGLRFTFGLGFGF
jgi:hypothetical protein